MPKFPAGRHPQAVRDPEAASPASCEAGTAFGAAAACEASAGGIAQCLRMLVEEAASVGLSGTVWALWMAIAVCEHEAAQGPGQFTAAPVQPLPSLN